MADNKHMGKISSENGDIYYIPPEIHDSQKVRIEERLTILNSMHEKGPGHSFIPSSEMVRQEKLYIFGCLFAPPDGITLLR